MKSMTKSSKKGSGKVRKHAKVKKSAVKGSAPKDSPLRSMVVDKGVIAAGQGPITVKGQGTRPMPKQKTYNKQFFIKARRKG